MIKIVILLVVVVVILLIALVIIKKKTDKLKEKPHIKERPQSLADDNRYADLADITDSSLVKNTIENSQQTTTTSEPAKPEIIPAQLKAKQDLILPDQPNCKQKLPEDATLKRHFITQAHAEVAKLLGDRPTDSTLSRHYDSLFAYRLAEFLGK